MEEFTVDFNILEARNFFAESTKPTSRTVKDYEIDMECSSGREYSCNSSKKQRLSYGDILVRKPQDYVSTNGVQRSYLLTLDFSGNVSNNMYSRNIKGEFQSICENESILRLEPIIHPTHVNEIMSIYQNLISLPDTNSDIAKELVREIIYTLNAEISKKNYKLMKPTECISQIIIAYMQEHLNQHITLDELSKLVHIEKSYMVRLFRKETGKTPVDTLISMRLDRALDLIATTELSIYEIASQCGYNTVSFFISTYKQRYGVTPEAHREILKGGII